MSEFKKENRYVVLKLSKLTDHQKTALGACLAEIDIEASAMPECVVVESGWPNYRDTWTDVQAVTEGRFIPRAELKAERDALAVTLSGLIDELSDFSASLDGMMMSGMDSDEINEDLSNRLSNYSFKDTQLAEIRADAVLQFAGSVLAKYRYDITEWAKIEADKIRQGGAK
jgi:hypothetical protein